MTKTILQNAITCYSTEYMHQLYNEFLVLINNTTFGFIENNKLLKANEGI